MPKHEDLEFLSKKILNIGNEESILNEKKLSINKTPIPGKIKDSQVEVEKEILDSGDLLKDITEDFKETADIEENFQDMKEEKVDDFLSSLTSSDMTSEEDVLGDKPVETDLFADDSLNINSVDNLSSGNISPEDIFAKTDLTESKKDWDNLKEESLSDLDLLNIEGTEGTEGTSDNTEKEPEVTVEPDIFEEQASSEIPDVTDNDAANYNESNESNDNDIDGNKKEDESDLSAIFGTEPRVENGEDTSKSQDEFSLDGLIDDKENKLDSLDDLLKGTANIEPEKETTVPMEKGMDEGLVDLAGDFASQEMSDEEKPPLVDQTLSDLFPDEKKDDAGFDEFVENSEEQKTEQKDGGMDLPSDDILGDLNDIPVEKVPDQEEVPSDMNENLFSGKDESEKLSGDFDLESLDNLSQMQEKDFEIEKHEINEDDVSKPEGFSFDELPDETQERVQPEKEKDGEKEKEKPGKDTGVNLSNNDRKKIVSVLSGLPKEAELKIARAIISDKYSDRELKPLIDALISGDRAHSIFKVYEKITGDRSLSKIEISKFTGEEFRKYTSSFSYQFKKNILPVISLFSVLALIGILCIFLWAVLIEPTITASFNYAAGKRNLREKKFNDVEKYFLKAYGKQKRYNEVVEYADLYREYKRYVEAENKYDLAYSLKPNNKLKLKIADFYRELGRYEQSESKYNEVLKDNRDDIDAELGVARTYLDWSNEVSGKINDAKDAYQEALRINDRSPEAVAGLLNIYLRMKDDREIRKVYEYSERLIKKVDPAVYADLAGYYLDQENLDDIKNILTRASKNTGKTLYPEIDYQWARYKKILSISNEEKLHLENAINKLETMKKTDPNRYETPRYKTLLASAYNDLGENYDRYSKINIKAEEYFIKSIETNPDFGKAYYNLGNFELKNKVRYDEALNDYLRAEERGFTNDRQNYLIGWLNYKKEDYPESFKRINSLLEKYPDNNNLKLMTGTIFYRMGNYDLAESVLTETFNYFDEARQVRSPLSMSKKADRDIVNMLISLGNNLGATLQKKYEQTGKSKYLISATRYYSAAIENFGKLNEVPDSVLKEEVTQEDFDMVRMNKFPVTDVHINLRMVLYPRLGVEDPKIFEDFPVDFQ
jgi:tetratricopeptide (TPR) repeat protein